MFVMTLIDRILGFFGIPRIKLDSPLSLLGKDFNKVMDKVYASPYGIEEDIEWGMMYYRYDEEDPNTEVCAWETRKILHTLKHDNDDRVVAAGKVYIDKDKEFLEKLARKAVSGRRRIYGKVDYCHYGRYGDLDEEYYQYDDDIYIMVFRESGAYDHGHSVTIEYVLKDSARGKRKKESPHESSSPRGLAEDRCRIISDLEKNF